MNYRQDLNYQKIKTSSYNVVNPDLDLLHDILTIQSPSIRETTMTDFIEDYIENKFNNVIVEKDKIGNLYITKGSLYEDEYYPCVVAHTDEVHEFNQYRVVINTGDFFMGWCNKYGCRNGIGADDKVGIFIALTLLEYVDVLKIFLPVQEEVGLIGTKNAKMEWFKDVGYLMQCDRRGHSDLITFTNGVKVASNDFIEDVYEIMVNYKYKKASGTCTDIGGLVTQGVGVSAVNISCGYYDEHTDEELIYIPALVNCLNMVNYMIAHCGNSLYEHTPDNKRSYSYYDKYPYDSPGYDEYDDYYDSLPAFQTIANDVNLDKVSDIYDYPCNNCKDIGNCINCKKWD